MTATRFQDLCNGLSELMQVPRVDVGDSAAPVVVQVEFDGTPVDVAYFPAAHPDHAVVLFEFGEIPLRDPRALRMLIALLDLNYLTPQRDAPVLGRNPVTGMVTLRWPCPLAEATPRALLETIEQGARLAAQWRRDYFLDLPAKAADGASDPGMVWARWA